MRESGPAARRQRGTLHPARRAGGPSSTSATPQIGKPPRGDLVRPSSFILHPSEPAFTLIELLVSLAIVSLLLAILLPALASARGLARQSACASNLRQMGVAWVLYANDFADRVMPLAYTDTVLTGGGDSIFWWGTDGSVSGRVDPSRGFLTPYLSDTLRERSVYECPEQPWGTYRPQGAAREITCTYGYNGYYLSPPHTPGWSAEIGTRPWRRLADLDGPADLLIFADTMLDGSPPSNNALIDPPWLFQGARWVRNDYPTICFRHGVRSTAAACSVRGDGSAGATRAREGWVLHEASRTGSMGVENGPHHVPDWRAWR